MTWRTAFLIGVWYKSGGALYRGRRVMQNEECRMQNEECRMEKWAGFLIFWVSEGMMGAILMEKMWLIRL
jgi:hypothetical protein